MIMPNTKTCVACAVAWIMALMTLVSGGVYLLINSHEIAGGWLIAAAILYLLSASCKKFCRSFETEKQWNKIDRDRKKER